MFCRVLYGILDSARGGEEMGMTDRQFDAFQEDLLELLREAKAEALSKGVEIVRLEKMIANIERRLAKP